MKKIKFFWIVFIPGFLFAQSILKIQEIDNEGKPPHEGYKVADINSEIQIYLDKEQLKQIVKKQMPEESRLVADNLIGQIETLQGILAQGLPLINKYEADLQKWLRQSEEERNLEALLRNTVIPLGEIQLELYRKFPRGTPLRDRLNETIRSLPGASAFVTSQGVFTTARDYLSGIQQQLNDTLKQSMGSIQLGAWISSQTGNRPVHLPGFDYFQLGERYEVGRFNFSMAEQQRENLKQIAQLVDSVGQDGIQPGLKSFTENMKPVIQKLLAYSLEHTKKFIEESPGPESGPAKLMPEFTAQIKNLQDKTKQHIAFLEERKNKYDRLVTGAAVDIHFLAGSIEDLALFMKTTNDLLQAVQQLQKSSSNIQTTPGSVVARFIGSIPGFENDLESTMDWAEKVAGQGEYLLGVKKVSEEFLAFSKEVIKHSLESLPSETRFSLLHAGPRQDGDILVIRLGMSTTKEPHPRTLERHDLRLYRQFYVETKASMAFVDHLANAREERKQFQLAPSYSVLFKWGNRKKVAYNQFWRPGIGLNIASPDLSLDEVPDIALSLTGSIINDWIQAGGGYNITGEAPYWFFALRLPIISLAPNSLDTEQLPMADH